MNNVNHESSKASDVDFEVSPRDQPIKYLLRLLLLNAVIYWSANIAPNKPYIFPDKEALLGNYDNINYKSL